MRHNGRASPPCLTSVFFLVLAGSLAAAAAAIAKDKVTNLPGFGAPLTDTYSG